MTEKTSPPHACRRTFLSSAAGLAGAAVAKVTKAHAAESPVKHQREAFYGAHQGGILTPQQTHTYFAAFDLTTDRRADVLALFQAWTLAASRMADGKPAQPLDSAFKRAVDRTAPDLYGAIDYAEPLVLAADTGEALGLDPQRLTITFGFGPGLFVKDQKDRFGLAAQRPSALVDMPRFVSDQLVEAMTGGDLSVQACADDPQVAFHAVRQLARIAEGVAHIKWVQAGFLPNAPAGTTPRNLMGFKDGTHNPAVKDRSAMARYVWSAEEGPEWMNGGTYGVVRRIRIALEHWDRVSVPFQEQTIGRSKVAGAPLGKTHEMDQADFSSVDKDGNPIIPQNAHLRLASSITNDGAEILRRGYSYNNGANNTAERWPPWRQALEYDAGLLFVCYQRDPRTGFIKIYEKMSKFDMLNQFVTHVGGGLFACPRGIAPGEYLGQRLFEQM